MSAEPATAPDDHAAAFFARLESGDLVGGRPRGYGAERAWNRMREAPDVRRMKHFFQSGDSKWQVDPGVGEAHHCGEFDLRRWPARVLSCLRRAAIARGDAWVGVHACFEEPPRPGSWWVRAGWIDADIDAHGHEFERWLVAEDFGWAATVDEYGVLRVFGDRAFVDAFAALYDAGD